jgi:hypothetical protein
LSGLNYRNPCGNSARRGEVPPLKDYIREKQREGDAHPDYGFDCGRAQPFPAGDASDDTDFEEDDGDGT